MDRRETEESSSQNGSPTLQLSSGGSQAQTLGQQALSLSSSKLPTFLVDSGFGLLQQKKLRAAFTFAGQGFLDLDDLRSLALHSPHIRSFVIAAGETLHTLGEQQEFRWSGLLGKGFALHDWVLRPETRPASDYLHSCVISQPLIFVCQIARYLALVEQGLQLSREITPVLTGHSQGMMAALLVAESVEQGISLDRFVQYVTYMAWQGLSMAQAYEATGHPVREGEATSMAAVTGPTQPQLAQAITRMNQALPSETLSISLVNTRTRHVVSGPAWALQLLHDALQAQAKREADRKKQGQWAGKPLQVTWEYLTVGGAYHSVYMEPGIAPMRAKMSELGFVMNAQALQLDVLSPATGERFNDATDLTDLIIVQQFTQPVCWSHTLRQLRQYKGLEAILDLGPGDGVARLTRSALKGLGQQVFALATSMGWEQFTQTPWTDLPKPLDYRDFSPILFETEEGQVRVENRYTRETGHSPIILPGMTPTTVDVPLVAAAANAGFTAELAGGGQVTEAIFWERMKELQEALEPGREVVLNALYLDPYLWDLHVRKQSLVQKARRAGFPLCGVTISAGLPEVDEAVALLDEFHALGLWLNAFKPGTLAQVKHVVRIAQAAPHHTIFVHLEGGKAGGHHSWEDLDELLLESYFLLRQCDHLVLCVGGGIHSEERASALLTGTWSQAYDMPKMPVDAVFLGTLTMACKEATTSDAVKQALAQATGSSRWVMNGEVEGAMTSGKSQLNADIHYLENAAARCGRLLDQVAGDEEAVQQRREEVIDALNQTAKPYFGDLTSMTYLEVAQRLVELMCIGRHGRYEDGCWPDRSYRMRVADWLERTEARLTEQQEGSMPVQWGELADLDAPEAVLQRLAHRIPQAQQVTLHPADLRYFLHEVCRRPGKPVNFIPVIDANVRRWYKADSLWQAHDHRYTAEQVLVLPGPEALQGLREVDEPVASLLGRFEDALQESLLQNGVAPLTPTQRRPPTNLANLPSGFDGALEPHACVLTAVQPLAPDAWVSFVADRFFGPVARLFAATRVFEGKQSRPNPVARLCQAQPGAQMRLVFDDFGTIQQLTYRPTPDARELVTMTLVTQEGEPCARLEVSWPDEKGQPTRPSYEIHFAPCHAGGRYAFSIPIEKHQHALRSFYHRTLFGELIEPVALFASTQANASISPAQARAYAVTTGGKPSRETPATLPVDMVFSLTWEPLFRLLSCDELAGGLLQLVHLSNAVTLQEGWPIRAAEEVQIHAQVVRLENTETGRKVVTQSQISRQKQPCVLLESTFFIRGAFGQHEPAVQAHETLQESLPIETWSQLRFLQEHTRLEWAPKTSLALGQTLQLQATVQEYRPRQGTPRFQASGTLQLDGQTVGFIELDETFEAELHPLRALLQAYLPDEQVSSQQNVLARAHGQFPGELHTFAEISGDHNPIHQSQCMARLANLDEPIVHGMWTSARLNHFLLEQLAEGNSQRLRNTRTEFLATALPGERYALEATRVGVSGSTLRVEATAYVCRQETLVPIARTQADLQAKRTAYLFPGQGIQQPKMGMEGYTRSTAARAIWDRSDTYTRRQLGFSILHVVRNNPKELLVQGVLQRHPQGVLHLTQFTQVAMAVLAQAQVAELKEAGLFDPQAVICGHSVGEYNAIAVSGVLPLEAVVALVYQRGLAMHRLVARDEEGESGYRMVVIRPHYAGLNHTKAEELVRQIREETGSFLQIVNYNVRGRQYSVTGQIPALEALQHALDARRTHPTKSAYVEVPGIDVPFHSEVLVGGVDHFRETLDREFPQHIEATSLLGRYIPNLVPRPFSLSQTYIQEVFETTNSSVLQELLADFEAHQKEPAKLARTLLIELLAWQFASPVRWIETQELLVSPKQKGGLGVQRLVEIGVGYQPTLANMARYSLSLAGPTAPSVSILNIEAEAEQVFYHETYEDLLPPLSWQEESQNADPIEPTETNPPPPANDSAYPQTNRSQATATLIAPAQAYIAPTDRPVSVQEGLFTLLAIQAKIHPSQIQMNETIDDIFDGVSSRRNQVLLDLGAEFQMGPIDGAHEKPIADLLEEIGQRVGTYRAPGKYLQGCQEDALKRTLGRAGLGRKDVLSYLEETYGLGAGLSLSVLNTMVVETREGNSGRGGPLGQCQANVPTDRNVAKEWIDQWVQSLGAQVGLPLAKKSQNADKSGASVDARVVQELEERILGANGILMNTARHLTKTLGHEQTVSSELSEEQRSNNERLALYEAEHGKEYEALIAPRFDARKHVAFTSQWASSHRDLARLAWDAFNQRCNIADVRQEIARLTRTSPSPRHQDSARWFAKQAKERGLSEWSKVFQQIAEGNTKSCPPIVPSRPHLEFDSQGQMFYREIAQEDETSYTSFVRDLFPKSTGFDAATDGINLSGNILNTDNTGHTDNTVLAHAKKTNKANNAAKGIQLGQQGEWNAAFEVLLQNAAQVGMDFSQQTVLVTGASPGSIALACVRHFLRGGARVILTTTTYHAQRLQFYRELYEQEASLDAELHVVPFNQASYQDVQALVDWLFSTQTEQAGGALKVTKRAFHPSLFLPFAALKDYATLDQLNERADAVMRAMLLSVERLITAISTQYQQEGLPATPCHVVLPLSPNHGSFGGDGVYAETKAALEVLLHKWSSEREAWAHATTICASQIGWVRGTGLMDANNPVAVELERQTGIATFSSDEMGLLLAGLCTSEARQWAKSAPLRADLTGGFGAIDNIKEIVEGIREGLQEHSLLERECLELHQREANLLRKTPSHRTIQALSQWPPTPLGTIPTSAEPSTHPTTSTSHKPTPPKTTLSLQDMVVIVGSGEIGPCGSARTRFELEVQDELSAAGVLELAWMTGLIHFEDDGRAGTWVDTESGDPIHEFEIAERYRDEVRSRVGIRWSEPETAGFDVSALPVLTPIFLEKDFTFSVASAEEAQSFAQADPENTTIHLDASTELWKVTRRAGTEIRIPRKVRLQRRAAGLVPRGTDLEKFGISADMLEHVDRATLFNLIATVDAFLSAGTEPEELLRWLHPARIANTQGSGIGGMQSLHRLYLDHYLDRERQQDTLQETLINVIAAYVVQSYVGSYGTMSHPVGACATAALSLEEGMDKILAGKADFAVTGGYDDIGREGVVGFSDMNATANTDAMEAMGLEPHQMSRSNDARRKGFLEAQGGGTILLARGDIALRLGLPVQGVLAYAGSFGDGIHKSIPAPGLGALACAAGGQESPLARSLNMFGLTTDDIALVYKHDTSTAANDPNENELHQRIQQALGRTPGNPLFVVSQKTLTGHPKGGAAAWQTIGLCQSLATGKIPGNRNLDCVDDAMRRFSHMAFTNQSLQPGPAIQMQAGLLTSLGFGHVSGIALILHPDHFRKALTLDEYADYAERSQARLHNTQRKRAAILLGEETYFEKRNHRRFQAADGTREQVEEEAAMLLSASPSFSLEAGHFQPQLAESSKSQ